MKIYNFKKKIDTKIYNKILDYSLIQKSKMVFVDMMIFREKNVLDSTFERLISPFIIKKENVSEWPGTVSHAKKKNVMYVINIDRDLIEKIKLQVPTLWDWEAPRYPEDLSFLRQDGTPWFVSITHEKDVYMQLEDKEIKDIFSFFGEDLLEFFEDRNIDKNYLI